MIVSKIYYYFIRISIKLLVIIYFRITKHFRYTERSNSFFKLQKNKKFLSSLFTSSSSENKVLYNRYMYIYTCIYTIDILYIYVYIQ